MKKHLYLLFIVFILLMSWDTGKQDAALAAPKDIIPEQAIRLRIIANSDSAEDQWIKRKIRDVVVDKINPWVNSLDNIETARQVIHQHLSEIENAVNETMEKNGYDYGKKPKVELGIVPFPTKIYGQKVYPAGDYEALRITLGDGLGQNWWCVLFPPLCFVDMSTGEAVEKHQPAQIKEEANDKKEVEVKFFFAEAFTKLTRFLKSII